MPTGLQTLGADVAVVGPVEMWISGAVSGLQGEKPLIQHIHRPVAWAGVRHAARAVFGSEKRTLHGGPAAAWKAGGE